MESIKSKKFSNLENYQFENLDKIIGGADTHTHEHSQTGDMTETGHWWWPDHDLVYHTDVRCDETSGA
jgi:hypothetical protein